MVSPESGPICTGMIAALEVVAKLKAKAAPRTNVRIIDCSLLVSPRGQVTIDDGKISNKQNSGSSFFW
jgi:hypothetical protein